MTDDDAEYLTRPDPACPLCGETTCGFTRGGHCEGWQVRLPEEDVFELRDRIRAYWPHVVLGAVLGVALLVGWVR